MGLIKIGILMGRAAEFVGLSPILSWPRIIFSERVC